MTKECKCTFAQRTVGDGCEVCNPSKALEYALETIDELTAERNRLREALQWYADKKNWIRDKQGRLMIFAMDTNGPYVAFSALKEVED